MENKTKATATLAASALLAAGTMPSLSPLINLVTTSTGQFFLGLLNHGFIAATIGGLADWFAVTALFRKPLGIGYRTEILKRNRGRITDAIIDFVSRDLLNKENIMDTIREENTAQMLIEYFEKYRGRDKAKDLAYDILNELFAQTDSRSIANAVTPILEDEIKNLDADKIANAAVKILTRDKHSRKILTALLSTGKKILQSRHMQDAIYKKIVDLREAYEGDSAGRALVLSSMNLTDEKILSILNENVEKKINDTLKVLNVKGMVDNETAEMANSLIDAFTRFVQAAAADMDNEKFQANLRALLKEKVDTAQYIQDWLDVNVRGETDPVILAKISRQAANNPNVSRIIEIESHEQIWYPILDKLIDEKIDEFIESPVLQYKFDKLVKNFIAQMLEEYHDAIPAMIRERLDKFSDDELTEFVEGKVSDDLQMIRINGSVCGAAVGMLLYVVAQIIERVVTS
ncbi:MAG: DUF445 domain-containing protein [Selenomonadaceae bacterium]|nr:DUF445 domain-containing protein [Selenomonadaceae bacterium]